MNDGCDHTSTNALDPIRTPKLSVNSVVRTGDGAFRMGVTGGVMRRCAWRLSRWGQARALGGRMTGDGGVEDGRDGRCHASVRVDARSVGGRLGRWEEGGA
ncbi:hypothetical protein KY284_000957 [Solanum tuberosum]|nr:hypothetical protein KY284_000957 [Solanum tuberosum]